MITDVAEAGQLVRFMIAVGVGIAVGDWLFSSVLPNSTPFILVVLLKGAIAAMSWLVVETSWSLVWRRKLPAWWSRWNR